MHTKRNLRVLDIGGAAGYHYFIAQALIGTKIDWRVVETTAMASRAKAAGLEERGLRFFDNATAAAFDLGGVDLIMCSGSLPFFTDPLATLKSLKGLGATYFFITRTPMSSNHTFTGEHQSRLAENGPGPLPPSLASLDRAIKVPITYVVKDSVISILKMEYDIKAEFIEEQGSFSLGDGSETRFDNYGFFCRLRQML